VDPEADGAVELLDEIEEAAVVERRLGPDGRQTDLVVEH